MRFLFLLLVSSFCWGASKPPSWELISREDQSRIVLVGGIHFGMPEMYPLPAEIISAAQEASAIAVEVDVRNIGPLAPDYFLSGRGSLSLEAEDLKNLKAISEELSLDFDQLLSYKPWFTAIQIASQQLVKSKFEHQFGLDRFFLNGLGDAQSLIELESFEAQMATFDQLAPSVQLTFLTHSIRKYDASADYLHSLAKAWMHGEVDTLNTLLVDSFVSEPTLLPIYEALILARNERMAAGLSEAAKVHGSVFAVVGVSHLVGQASILDLMAKNYTVKRVLIE